MSQFYMVEFDLPEVLNPKFLSKVPQQRKKIDELMALGKVRSYSLSEDRSKLWMVIVADTEDDVLDILEEMPLNYMMDNQITPLMFHFSNENIMAMSLN
jgi:muconolactone delta-isomerase